MPHYQGLIARYGQYLDVDPRCAVTLNEGNTILLKLRNLPKTLGLNANVYIKFEGLNPTGSFKDRGMTMAMSRAVQDGARAVVCASTGNTAASAAAYAAAAGLPCYVLLPDNQIAMGKLAQAVVYGAHIIAVQGNFDDALRMVLASVEEMGLTLVNSLNPYRLEGQKTAAFEICDDLGRAPEYLVLPVGNAGNITAYWMGFTEYFSKGIVQNKPKIMGFQAWNSAPIVLNKVVEEPETIATAIRIGNPASWERAVAARDESGGLIDRITDEQILAAQRLLAADGIFAEPASCASIAGLCDHVQRGLFRPAEGENIVCILTGNGLKDTNIIMKTDPTIHRCAPEMAPMREIMTKLM
ncbi:MAG: threonine synthase [Clostridia bacterium]|nr:threonine synthase [Clostridia bacterium]